MAINLDAIRNRLNKLQNTQNKAAELWKPTPGKHQVRLVPYKFNKENPFIELYFHYGINGKTYLSPISFGRPDPIVEFADKLKRMGDKDDWKAAKKMEPKLRTFVPVLVRGEEGEGIRFWGFGKTVYQEILGYIADDDYGDITHPTEGRDIVVEIISAEEAGKSYPVTTIRVKPKETPLADTKEQMVTMLDSQQNVQDVYQELTYDELKGVLESWLNPGSDESDDEVVSTTQSTLAQTTPVQSNEVKSATKETAPFDADAGADVKPKTSTKVDDVASAFDDLFNS
jgi:hypothetical protein